MKRFVIKVISYKKKLRKNNNCYTAKRKKIYSPQQMTTTKYKF